jgi:hypothetical protein
LELKTGEEYHRVLSAGQKAQQSQKRKDMWQQISLRGEEAV